MRLLESLSLIADICNMLDEGVGNRAALVGSQTSEMHDSNVVCSQSVALLSCLPEVLIGRGVAEFDLVIGFALGECDGVSAQVEGTQIVPGVDTPEVSCLLEAPECLLQILPDFPKDVQLRWIRLKNIWSMIINVATSIKGSWIFLHGWLLEVCKGKLNILWTTPPQQIHETNEIIRLWISWINV